MSDELERRLHDAFDAQARASIADSAVPPEPRFAAAPARAGWGRRLAPLAAAAAVLAVIGGVVAVARSGSSHSPVDAASQRAANTVHVRLHNDEGATYGVGMPVIAYFSKTITDGRPLEEATVATVDGRRVQGAWYFEKSAAGEGPIEAHYRLANYWPANSDIKVSMPIEGLSAGDGLTFDDSLTTEFHTGPAIIATVDDSTHRLTLKVGGKSAGAYPVSLGLPSEPTRSGIKVIMEKPGTITLSGSTFKGRVEYAQRLTYGGEYLLAAPWNTAHIKAGINSSDGSTDLMTADAKLLFDKLEIGDVVQYVNCTGTPMTVGSGYGDWNVKWPVWLKGGLVPTH